VLTFRVAMAFGLAGSLVLVGSSGLAGPGDSYRDEILKWRLAREEGLKKEGGWLSVAGLFWLNEGQNAFGTAAENDIVLPAGTAALRAGSFDLRSGKVVVSLLPGVAARVGGQSADGRELRSDATGEPDVVTLGRLSLYVISRGARLAIRLKDPESAARKSFTRLSWFEVAERARVRARFVPFDPPKSIRVPNILGQSEDMPSPGYCAFEWGGREVRLSGVLEEEGAQELFFIFRDETSGKETYPAGRFLYSELPKDGEVVLDFNKAYNPPCAFTAFATCPLPPPENWLPVAVAAGEKRYAH
jgi:uncharacterized protein (DUF1684 family)